MSKLTTLSQLKSGLQAAKSYTDAQDAVLSAQIEDIISDIEGIVATGGEANILEGIKVNNTTLTITDKIAELLVETGSENGTINVAGTAVAVAGLKKLAFADEISEADFSDSLKASFAALATAQSVTDLGAEVTALEGRIDALEKAGYQTAAQCEAIALAAVAASGHAHFEKVDAIPEAAEAEENVMYLVPAADGDGFVIYAKVGDGVEPLGHTKVDLSGYSTTEQMNAAIEAAVEGIKIGDYAKLADLNALAEDVAALETAMANVYTKEEIDNLFGGYYTTTQMDAKLAEKMNISEMGAYATDEEAAAEADAAEAAAKAHAEEKASAAEAAAKQYADDQIAAATASDEEVAEAVADVFGTQA